MKTKHLGSYGEITATAWLLKEGYEVFTNASSHGPIDVVALNIKTGEILYIDVKVQKLRRAKTQNSVSFLAGARLTKEQKALGIKLLYVLPSGVCSFDRETLKVTYSKEDYSGD